MIFRKCRATCFLENRTSSKRSLPLLMSLKLLSLLMKSQASLSTQVLAKQEQLSISLLILTLYEYNLFVVFSAVMYLSINVSAFHFANRSCSELMPCANAFGKNSHIAQYHAAICESLAVFATVIELPPIEVEILLAALIITLLRGGLRL